VFVPGQEDVAPSTDRTSKVVQRILSLSEEEVRLAIHDVRNEFGARHSDIDGRLAFNAHVILSREGLDEKVPLDRRLLIGAAFTREFAVEGAAVCNPSIVRHPDQTNIPDGSLRFVMSVRGIGEGHKSSIGFRTGVIDEFGSIEIHRPMPQLLVGSVEDDNHTGLTPPHGDGLSRDYSVSFPRASDISERLLWPHSRAEQQGMEDARFTQFTSPEGDQSYLATYTAFDGAEVFQQALETRDFASFHVFPLAGRAAHGKGLAFFPRKIGSQFVALTRADHESNFVSFSDTMTTWDERHLLPSPHRPWEVIQRGNCGSPIETEAGWLVLTHAVGAVRSYSISAMLLDLEDPTRIVGELTSPLLEASSSERDGYVPNVVYSCGSIVHGDVLTLPYGIADNFIGVATVQLSALLERLTSS
jgi:predicted GH43/DUF377 family glycosyl hydrolase